jgi:dTDP-4-amino-4,6-dideoxygalactose transaminase
VIVVHLYGHMPDMDRIADVTQRAGVHLIEDAAQAHGATWKGRRAGSFGIAGCFSFYPGKNLGAIGDGGAVVSSDPALIDAIRELGDHGRSALDRSVHVSVGTNSRLDALQAAVLSAKLARLDDWTASRRRIAQRYASSLPPDVTLVSPPPGCASAYHLFVVRVADRDDRQRILTDRGIATGIHYAVPCHRNEPYARYASEPLPAAEHAASEILSLPMFPHMTDDQIDRVVDALTTVEVNA